MRMRERRAWSSLPSAATRRAAVQRHDRGPGPRSPARCSRSTTPGELPRLRRRRPATICTSVNRVVVHGIRPTTSSSRTATSSPSTAARSSTAGGDAAYTAFVGSVSTNWSSCRSYRGRCGRSIAAMEAGQPARRRLPGHRDGHASTASRSPAALVLGSSSSCRGICGHRRCARTRTCWTTSTAGAAGPLAGRPAPAWPSSRWCPSVPAHRGPRGRVDGHHSGRHLVLSAGRARWRSRNRDPLVLTSPRRRQGEAGGAGRHGGAGSAGLTGARAHGGRSGGRPSPSACEAPWHRSTEGRPGEGGGKKRNRLGSGRHGGAGSAGGVRLSVPG